MHALTIATYSHAVQRHTLGLYIVSEKVDADYCCHPSALATYSYIVALMMFWLSYILLLLCYCSRTAATLVLVITCSQCFTNNRLETYGFARMHYFQFLYTS